MPPVEAHVPVRALISRGCTLAEVHISRDWGHIRRSFRAQVDKELIPGREVCILHE